MEKDLKNKITVVTGAAQGIGYEIARSFLNNEAKVTVILDINKENGNKSVEKLTTEFGPDKALFIECNVVDDLEDVFEKILKKFGRVDVLVNNAGIDDEGNPEKCIGVNLTATIKWSLKFYELMRKNNMGNGGTIVNIASIAGYFVTEYFPVYHATKFGVFGFTKSLGHQNRYNENQVRVIAICPGFTKTEMSKKLLETEVGILMHKKNNFSWQRAEDVGDKTIEVFKMADSGTVWEIQGGKLKEVK